MAERMTDQQIADGLYPEKAAAAAQQSTGTGAVRGVIDEVARAERLSRIGKRSDEELAAALYPSRDFQDPRANNARGSDGKIQEGPVLRDTEGLKMADAAPGQEFRYLVASNADNLRHADLKGFDGSRLSLNGSRGADARGASFKNANLVAADARDIEFDEKTDLEGANIEGLRISVQTLRKAKNWKKAVGHPRIWEDE